MYDPQSLNHAKVVSLVCCLVDTVFDINTVLLELCLWFQ